MNKMRFTTENHPQKNAIHTIPLENLKIMIPTLEYAVNTWKKDTTHSQQEREYNQNYFGVYLKIVENRIKKLEQ